MNGQVQKEATAAPDNLFDEPFEKWWRDYATVIDMAMVLGTRDAWRHVACAAFVCGAIFGSHHVVGKSNGPADEPGENSDEADVDRGRSR